MFNYLVALFHKRPVRQGLFGKPIFEPSLDHHFGWLGLICAGGGAVMSLGTLFLGLNGWAITRLWFYQLVSAMLFIIGIQLCIGWIVMRVLEELACREGEAQRDMVESEPANVKLPSEAVSGAEIYS